MTRPRWGLDDEALDDLAPTIDAVVNMAAETNWAAPRTRLHAVNVLGALHGLAVAEALRQRHPRCGAYIYAGSIYAAGERRGPVPEERFGPGERRTDYEHSKWLAEEYLIRRPTTVGVGIIRVGGLLGDSADGRTAKRNSFYLLADGTALPGGLLPVVAGTRVDMLPRDVAAEALLRVAAGVLRLDSREPQLMHLCAGPRAPLLVELLACLRRLDPWGINRRPIRTVPASSAFVLRCSTDLRLVWHLPTTTRLAVEGLRYLALDRYFELDRLNRFLPEPLSVPPTELLARLLLGRAEPATSARPMTRPFARLEPAP